MTTILLILITWYITKLYYTRDFTINMPKMDYDLRSAQCSKCARMTLIHKDNMRSPFYCNVCM